MLLALSVRLPIFDLGAAPYDWLTRQALWREQIARVLAHVRGSPRRVLDLGCGPGVSAFVLAERLGPDAQVTGIDLSPKMIERAEAHLARRYPQLASRVRFEVADATRTRFEDAAFDLAVGHSFLYLVPDRPAVLREVRRLLAPGGTLVLMEPNARGSLLTAAQRARAHAGELLRRPSAALRFVASMVLWRTVSGAAGRIEPEQARRLLTEAGFDACEIHPTIAGLGLHLVGRVAKRPADTAAASDP
ncbi:MAG: class I SAM-dependent methyltransferase [Planctomycetota bacterium]|nr:MAG: class I SAM-dependent methyltransferase [Planctomycetota bacterium]